MIYPQNPPGTSKNQPETLKNHENPLGTMKNKPGTLKNHKNRPGTITNQPGTLKTIKPTWSREKLIQKTLRH